MARAWWLGIFLFLTAASATHAAELKIATWNLNWLSARTTGLPSDVRPREAADFDRLQGYARELNADVVALQEVDNAETARRVFPPERYSIHLSRDHVRQRVGFAVRRGLSYDVNPDLTELALDPMEHLRSGADITLRAPAGSLRLLAVHLKEGCQYATFGRSPRSVCVTLMAQFDIVARWIADRRGEDAAFLVLGDFNRDMDRSDPFALKLAAGMTRATEGFSSPCWGREAFIDHILLGEHARAWLIPSSLRVLAYRETEPDWKARLSDHCPVSIRLTVPD